MEESRIKKTARNMFFAIGYKLVDTILAFVLRSVFIYTLGINYLGIKGLFINILAVLSLMDLGIGSAIAFSLYRPLAEKDEKKIVALMQLYKKLYTAIGWLVCVIGISISPFLNHIINMPTQIDDLYLIYTLSVLNTSMTYFLAYRRTLLIADQRSDLCTRVDIVFRFIRCVGLICVMVITRNYILYLLYDLINTIFSNLVIAIIVKRKYAYISTNEKRELDRKEKKKIIKYVSSGIFSRIGQTMVASTDSIIISTYIGTVAVGLYSNYNMIYANLDTLIYMIFSNLTPSVGNYAVSKEKNQLYSLFKNISLLNYFIVCIISVCFYCLVSPFIVLWVGKQYLLSDVTVVIIALNFYIATNQNCIINFMNANGELYYRNRYRALIEGGINIVASVLLVKYTNLGMTGVFLGTTICFMFGRIWMDARVLYKYWFQVPFSEYLKSYAERMLCTITICVVLKRVTYYLLNWMGVSIISWIICALGCVCVCASILVIIWRKTTEYAYMISLGKRMLVKILKNDK